MIYTQNMRLVIRKMMKIANFLWHNMRPFAIKRLLTVLHGCNDSQADKVHLDSTMQWLCLAQDVCSHGGVASAFALWRNNWLSAYPETTGYIIPTFLYYGTYYSNSTFVKRAIMLGDWEIEVQLPTGAVRGGGGLNHYPIVFNTGQVILGWMALYHYFSEKRFLEAAVKAADWLVEVQASTGEWKKFSYRNALHTYNSRVAWGIFEVFKSTNFQKYADCANRHIDWILKQYEGNGWFRYMSFSERDYPLTHTIGYTLSGLIECMPFLPYHLKQEVSNCVWTALDAIMEKYSLNVKTFARLPGRFDSAWNSQVQSSCLTGNAQIAIAYLRAYQLTGEKKFKQSAFALIEGIKRTQCIQSSHPEVTGGIAGSYPLWGDYGPFTFPAWAAKFFADSLILKEQIEVEGQKPLHYS